MSNVDHKPVCENIEDWLKIDHWQDQCDMSCGGSKFCLQTPPWLDSNWMVSIIIAMFRLLAYVPGFGKGCLIHLQDRMKDAALSLALDTVWRPCGWVQSIQISVQVISDLQVVCYSCPLFEEAELAQFCQHESQQVIPKCLLELIISFLLSRR